MLIKKKYFVLLATLPLVFVLGYSTTSLGYSWDELCDFAEQVSNDTTATVRQRSLANMLLDHENGWTNYLTEQVGNLNNIKGIWVFNNGNTANDTTDRVEMWIWTYVPNLDFSGSGGSGISPTTGRRANYGLGYTSSDGIYRNNISTGSSMTRNKGFGLIETSNTGTIYSGWYLQNRYTPRPQIYFTPNYDEHVNVNSYFSNVNALKYDYSVRQWGIGTTTNFSNLHDYVFELRDSTNFTDVGFVQRSSGQASGGALYYDFRENTLFVNSRYIKYNRVYRLLITEHFTSENMQYEEFYYIFLPLNATISGDTIVNVGSGDYNIQDSTNDIIDNVTDEGNVEGVLNDYLPSGDITNIATSNFQFTLLDNPFSTFLWHLLDSVYGALVDRGNVKLEANYKTMHFELNSSDFTLPDSDIKTFIRTVLIFLYIYGNYKYFHYLISLLETANIDRVIAELGTDEFYDSDIM